MNISDGFEPQIVWKQACLILAKSLSPAVFNTWIIANPLTDLVETDGGYTAIITSPTAFHATNLQKNLHQQILGAIQDVVGSPVTVHYQVGSKPSALSQPAHSAVTDTDYATGQSTDTVASINPPLHQSPRVEELFSQHAIASASQDRLAWRVKQIGLNSSFVFETFAVSTTNEMAHAAAVAVSNKPGHSYNPLFLYGGVGVGKTHLMHAIGNNVLASEPDTNIVYCTGEEFTNEIVQAIQTKRANAFKHKYRSASMLLIDDIQFIAGKTAVQEEFFHTFNALTQQHSQIVLTSDRPPQEISLLEDRLRSRFEAGLMIDIGQPSFELRTAIVLLKAKAAHLPIDIDLAKQIAQSVTGARKIEGIITSIRSAVELKHREVDAQLITELIQVEDAGQNKIKISVHPGDVIKTVADHYRVKQIELKGVSRQRHIVTARHVAMYLLHQDVGLPLTEIARWFGGRDHTSVLHATRKIAAEIEISGAILTDISTLRHRLRGRINNNLSTTVHNYV